MDSRARGQHRLVRGHQDQYRPMISPRRMRPKGSGGESLRLSGTLASRHPFCSYCESQVVIGPRKKLKLSTQLIWYVFFGGVLCEFFFEKTHCEMICTTELWPFSISNVHTSTDLLLSNDLGFQVEVFSCRVL